MTQRRGYSEWVKLVEELEKSSSSLEDFAAKLGVKPSTFQFWFYKLRKQASRPSQFLPVDVVASAPNTKTELLETIPSIGVLSSRTIVAALDDVKRFDNSKEVAKYGALTPTIYQSGEVVQLGEVNESFSAWCRAGNLNGTRA